MFQLVLQLVLRPRFDSANSFPGDTTFYQTGDGHLMIDLGDRRIEVEKEDISKLRKLLDLYQEP